MNAPGSSTHRKKDENLIVRSPALKRIIKEIQEIQTDPSDYYYAHPLEQNLFEWHFTIKGPEDSEFRHGLYHGKILLPNEYPFKPPWVIFLTPNGRFELNKKICLSVTAHHPEEWHPAWGIRTVLMAVMSHFPVSDKGSIGYLDYSIEERQKLALQSVNYVCETCHRPNLELITIRNAESAPFSKETLAAVANGVPNELLSQPSENAQSRTDFVRAESITNISQQNFHSKFLFIFLSIVFILISFFLFLAVNK